MLALEQVTENEAHLLLVEDEPALRAATAERLAEHGYRVVRQRPERPRSTA